MERHVKSLQMKTQKERDLEFLTTTIKQLQQMRRRLDATIRRTKNVRKKR